MIQAIRDGKRVVAMCAPATEGQFGKDISMAAIRAALKKAGFTLLGYDYHMVGNGINYEGVADAVTEGKYTYIDNMYMQTLVRRGLVFLALFLAATTWLMRKLMDREPQGYLMVMLALLALQAVIQDNFFQLCYNPMLLLYGIVLMRSPEDGVWESPLLERIRARRRGGPGPEPGIPEPVAGEDNII